MIGGAGGPSARRAGRLECLLVVWLWLMAGVVSVDAATATDQETRHEEQRLQQMDALRESRAEIVDQARDAAIARAVADAQIAPTGPPAAAVLETLKQRAQEIILKRRARRWMLTTSTTLSAAIETNPNFDASRKGDGFFEEDTDLLFRWRWFQGLTQDIGHRLTNTHYIELRDSNYLDNTLYTGWRYTPAPWLRVTSGYEFEALNYYEGRDSSFNSHRVYVQARHTLPKYLYYQAGWSWLYRRYSVRHARDGDGLDTDDARHDTRHTMHVEVGSVVKDTYLSVRQEGAWHFSNDAYQDLYDYQSYRVRATVARDFWRVWRGSGTFSFERKNYTERLVSTDIVKAEYDNAFTYGVSLTYSISPDVNLTYSYTRRKQDSNAPASEYTDTTNQFSLTAGF